MCPNSILNTWALRYLNRKYMVAKVFSLWVHAPLETTFFQRRGWKKCSCTLTESCSSIVLVAMLLPCACIAQLWWSIVFVPPAELVLRYWLNFTQTKTHFKKLCSAGVASRLWRHRQSASSNISLAYVSGLTPVSEVEIPSAPQCFTATAKPQ